MLIAIISDIHDNLANLEKCLKYLNKEKVEKIICLGDLTNLETVSFLSRNFTGEIFLIRGNADNYETDYIKNLPAVKYLGEINKLVLNKLTLGLCHEPEKIKRVKKIYQPTNFDFIFYGHTHKPWLENKDGVIIANPGTLGGVFYPATFAILKTNTKNLTLKRLEELN